ncbi:MAG: putative ATP-dependent RNA helicase [Methanomassiliicoccales archaeon PtaU1.Bin124]|nr:MAG: putative ATP-dependent RNA helicase [Methanomassiliicoccales archaeon PtaU1.Bin124]
MGITTTFLKLISSAAPQFVFLFIKNSKVENVTGFTDLKISNEIIKAMKDMGWQEPTPIQVEAIPAGLNGKDMFALAQTGTGKTGAFGTIILENIQPGYRTPSALVLVPTRELANQVFEELNKLAKYSEHLTVPIYGGVGLDNQIQKLRRGTDIVVATPGRAVDLLNRRELDLRDISVVVLDEADRMLDMGFAKDLNFILAKLPKKRQSLMFSATMSPDIRQLAKRHMVDPMEILVSKDEPVLDLTKQYFLIADKDTKRDALCTILDMYKPKAIVFCHTKRKVDQLTKKLKADNYLVGAIHGDVAQNKRERVLKAFKDGTINIMVATDVAARGLDIDAVDYVFNYDAPVDPDTYVHRIGRTGRAGAEGTAVAFFTPEEKGMVKSIEKKTGKPIAPLEIEIVRRPRPEGESVVHHRPPARPKQGGQREGHKAHPSAGRRPSSRPSPNRQHPHRERAGNDQGRGN